MKQIVDQVKDNIAVSKLASSNTTIISGNNSIEALLISASFLASPRKIVVLENNLYNATRLYDRLDGFVDDNKLLFFGCDESFALESISTNSELLFQRIETLNKILKLDSFILVTHTAAFTRLLPSKEDFEKTNIKIKIKDIIKPYDLIQKLISNGYSFSSKIEHPLQYSIRGGVVDIYSINLQNPVRIEFFGDEVDSIRYFNIDTQRTIEEIKEVDIISATDLIFDRNNLDELIKKLKEKETSLLDKSELNNDIQLLSIDPPYHLINKYYSLLNKQYCSLLSYIPTSQLILIEEKSILDNYNLLVNDLKDKSQKVYFNLLDLIQKYNNKSYIERFANSNSAIDFGIKTVESFNGNYKQFEVITKGYLNLGYKIVICLDNQNQYECIKQYALEMGEKIYDKDDAKHKSNLKYSFIPLKDGFIIEDKKIVYLTSHEIFGINSHNSKYYSKYKNSVALKSYNSLEINDYIVHEDYGIGQFLGIETIEINGNHKDYLHIKYAGSAKVDIPVENFKCIRKYVGRDGAAPTLSKLGGKEWSKTKEKIKARIKELTESLMKLYLNRTKEIGFAFSKDEEYQKEFENAFPFDLTIDQARSLEEIKKDMESPLPMDRLLCGDVGFGKTEVAFRAAFKTIVNGKQVALLCPTTLLARQHYEVAKKRFKNFPVEIRMVSRLVSNKEIKKIYEQTLEGKISFIIGTHKLLNKDLKFKDLGLLIVDEEQRFGVEHKEKIKQLKNGVDVLTLSATPIPRTMQSSLVGMRSLSQIETPIENRLSVQTYILENNINLAKEIISREIARLGQVYYIHNNIDTIFELEAKLKALIPSLKIGVIHGRMNKDDIEDVMISFLNHDLDLLISTTIIENGLDIANANTIIIDEADTFGLSQLYQLKGRVGRSERLGYCYLFYNPEKIMNENAKKRLQAIKEFSELGSGYRIALRDLTIRGAGDLLGKEQAGFIDSVGIDMYLSLLQDAIDESKGIIHTEEKTHRQFDVDAYIPAKFTNDDLDKIELYKKIGEVSSLNDLKKLKDEMDDIYGKIPQSVNLLLEKRQLELFIKDEIVEDIIDRSNSYEIVLNKKYSEIDGIGIDVFKIVNDISLDIELGYRDEKIRILINKSEKNWLNKANKLLNNLRLLFNKYI